MTRINLIKSELQSAVNFIQEYHDIGNCHMVEFLATKQWDRLISSQAQQDIKNYCNFQNTQPNKEHLTPLICDVKLKESSCCIKDFPLFYESFLRNNVGNSKLVELPNILKLHEQVEQHHNATSTKQAEITTKEFMCPKKSHEVEKMSEVVHLLGRSIGTNTVLDIGAGKGYLGSYLSLRHRMKVIGVDCSDANSRNAMNRANKFMQYWKKNLKNKSEHSELSSTFDKLQFESVTAKISENVDVKTLISGLNSNNQDYNDEFQESEEVVICGLHACGDLSSAILRCFSSNQHCKAVCVVGCCYHWLTEVTNENDSIQCFPMSKYLTSILTFELGRNTRMLSLRALQKTAATSQEEQGKSEESLFFRAVLTLILEDLFGIPATSKDICIGGIYKKCNGFVEYIRKALKMLKLSQDNISDEEILKYYERNHRYQNDIRCFNMLRSLLGSVVEHAILLDRLLYLYECGIDNTHLVKLFDPILSPRCYAIIAWKDALTKP